MTIGFHLLPESGSFVPYKDRPMQQGKKPVIVEGTLQHPGSTSCYAAVGPPQSLMEWMMFILARVQMGSDWRCDAAEAEH